MPQDPVTKPDKPLDVAIRTLAAVTDADDLRWLSAFISIENLKRGKCPEAVMGRHSINSMLNLLMKAKIM